TGAWREVQLDPEGRLRVPPGVALDLGATGKAFAADRISSAIASRLGTGCILSLGGDVAVGVAADGEHPWQVSVSERPDGAVEQTLTLPRGGIATSTTVHRTWTHGGRAVHHVLDPDTGLPVQRTWRTVTAIADTCLEANTATTAALVLGERAPDWLDDRGLSARLVAQDGTMRTLGEWPDRTPEGQL
ncbi:MAG: FAD:protein FMN transferase, partial [Kineosporiaceae bacterium]